MNPQTAQITAKELEEKIKDVMNEYTQTNDKLMAFELVLRDKEVTSHRLLRKMFHGQPDEALKSEYKKSEEEYDAAKEDFFDCLCLCHRHLQQLRGLEHTYFSGVFNNVNKELAEARRQTQTSATSDTTTGVHSSIASVEVPNTGVVNLPRSIDRPDNVQSIAETLVQASA